MTCPLGCNCRRHPQPLGMICISCTKKLEPVSDDTPHQPNDGVYLRTYGNYGSRQFDSIFGEEQLEMYICDDCLTAKMDIIYHLTIINRPNDEVLTPWREHEIEEQRRFDAYQHAKGIEDSGKYNPHELEDK